MSLDACRRNNKMEKRKRNRDYARKFKTVSICGTTDLMTLCHLYCWLISEKIDTWKVLMPPQPIASDYNLQLTYQLPFLSFTGRWKQKGRCNWGEESRCRQEWGDFPGHGLQDDYRRWYASILRFRMVVNIIFMIPYQIYLVTNI